MNSMGGQGWKKENANKNMKISVSNNNENMFKAKLERKKLSINILELEVPHPNVIPSYLNPATSNHLLVILKVFKCQNQSIPLDQVQWY